MLLIEFCYWNTRDFLSLSIVYFSVYLSVMFVDITEYEIKLQFLMHHISIVFSASIILKHTHLQSLFLQLCIVIWKRILGATVNIFKEF